MQRATKDILYFEIGPDNEPTLRVSPGEEFEVETQLNPGPWLDDHPEREMLRQKLRGGNPSSGCIYIEGAMPGQVLSVNIGEIDLDPVGFTNYWGSTGAMPGWMGPSGVGEHKKAVHIREGKLIFFWGKCWRPGVLSSSIRPSLMSVKSIGNIYRNKPEVRIIER